MWVSGSRGRLIGSILESSWASETFFSTRSRETEKNELLKTRNVWSWEMKGWHFQKLLLHVNVLLNAVYYGDVFYKPYGLFSHLSSTEAIKCVLGGWAFRESRSVGAALTVKTWGVCVCVCVYRFGCRPADRHPSTHQTPVSQTPDGGKELQHQGQVWTRTRTRTRISPAARTGSDSAADVLLSVSSGFWMKFCRKWFIWCRRKSVWVGLCNTVTHTHAHTRILLWRWAQSNAYTSSTHSSPLNFFSSSSVCTAAQFTTFHTVKVETETGSDSDWAPSCRWSTSALDVTQVLADYTGAV